MTVAEITGVVALTVTVSTLIVGGAMKYVTMIMTERMSGFELRLHNDLTEKYLKRLEWLLSEATNAQRMARLERRVDKTENNE
jgi:hypothetical protein